MVKQPHLITNKVYFVPVAPRRRLEAQAALDTYGIPHERQHYLDFPDGELEYFIDGLREDYLRLILAYNIGTLLTTGTEGWDGHPDHISAHVAAEQAKKRAERDFNRQVSLLSLNSSGEGPIVFTGDPAEKFAAMQHHRTQHHMLATPEGPLPEPQFWQNFAPYHPLMVRETYDVF